MLISCTISPGGNATPLSFTPGGGNRGRGAGPRELLQAKEGEGRAGSIPCTTAVIDHPHTLHNSNHMQCCCCKVMVGREASHVEYHDVKHLPCITAGGGRGRRLCPGCGGRRNTTSSTCPPSKRGRVCGIHVKGVLLQRCDECLY